MRMRNSRPGLFGIAILAALGSAGFLRAQQPAPPQADPPGDPKPSAAEKKPDGPRPKSSIERETGTVNDRIFEVMPNYGTVYAPTTLPPMTSGQKFRLATAGAFDYFAYPFNLSLACSHGASEQ